MAKQELSSEEVWDDSALVISWNEALEEYKKYHSLAAKGEKVELILEKADAGVLGNEDAQAVKAEQPKEAPMQPPSANGDTVHATSAKPTSADADTLPTHVAPPATVPQMLLNTVQDEGLKNLMMSWYYAGYYTGLYEGQQKAYASIPQGG